MTFKSIRWQLQLWYGILLLAILVGFGVTAYQLESGRQWRRLDHELQRRVNVLAGAWRGAGPRGPFNPGQAAGQRGETERPDRPERLRPENSPETDRPDWGPRGQRSGRRLLEFRLPPQHAALFDDEFRNQFFYVVWARDGSVISQSTNAPSAVPMPPVRGVRGTQPPRIRENWREMFLVTPPGEVVLVGGLTTPENAELQRVAVRLAGVGAVVLTLGLAGGWWLATRAIRPIRSITDTANRISGGDLSHRISMAETESELGELASILNATFARLDAAFRQQQQFTSDAAHELRTPVTVMLTQTQMALNRERSVAEYRSTLEACQRSAQRMRQLIESLLELARLDAGQEQIARKPVELSSLARGVVETLRPIATEKQVRLELEMQEVECVGDGGRLEQVVTNLVSNAIHYNHPGGLVRVRTSSDHASAILEVSDDGPGIPEEHQPHVFKRFYRAESARTTSHGHSGLGLSISKLIVEAHGGAIELKSAAGKGTTFIVRLPRTAT